MIEIRNIVKKYGNLYAVNNISFTVNTGEIVGFLGPNGAGKSTTMNILTGYLSATSGTASIDGVDILEKPLEAKRRIGFLPEQPPLYPDMTVKEYLNFVYNLKHCTLNRKLHLEEICRVVQLTEVYGRLIKHLSKGYKQRVGIAQALVGNPPVLIFDEPTVGLDPKQIIEVRNLIRSLGEKHTVIKELGRSRTVILSTHILPEVQAVCDRIIVIDKGRIVADEETRDIGRAVKGTRRYHAKICGDPASVLCAVRSVPGVTYVERMTEAEEGSVRYLIEADSALEVRKPLFYTLAQNSMPLIGLESAQANLEDVFLSVIEKPEDTNANGKENAHVSDL